MSWRWLLVPILLGIALGLGLSWLQPPQTMGYSPF
jgi:hypothetical protein